MRIWYGIHPDELDATYAIRLCLDTIGLMREAPNDRELQYLYSLLIRRTLPIKDIMLPLPIAPESLPVVWDDFRYLLDGRGVPCNWPTSTIDIRRRVGDVKDWQAICRFEYLTAELMHSVRTYGMWPGGSSDVYKPTPVENITQADLIKYVRFCHMHDTMSM